VEHVPDLPIEIEDRIVAHISSEHLICRKNDQLVLGYTLLLMLLQEIGVGITCSGPAMLNLGKQVQLEIHDEQNTGQGVSLYFDISKEGDERFVCQA
jgi:hypothetical protein